MNFSGGKIRWGFLVILGIIVSVSLASFSLRNAIHDTVAQSANVGNASPVAQADTGPKYFYFNKISGAIPKVTASAYLVGDLDTGEIILTKNQNQKFPTASVSKLMTALVADEINGGDEVAQVTKRALATYGENGGFRLGEKMKVSDLFYPLLLESSNDAAEILAEHFDREAFVKKMNQEAAILQLSETSYEDPSGLSPKNQSTAYDLFKLAGFIHKEKHELLDITTLRSYSNNYDLVLVPDFANGFINSEIRSEISKIKTFTAINAQINSGNRGFNVITHYEKANFIALNEQELRLSAHDRRSEISEIVTRIKRKMSCDNMCITLGTRGVYCSSNDENGEVIPAFSQNSVDRVGAGDAFLALTAICLAKKNPLDLSAFIGSISAALKVQYVGNQKSINSIELSKYIVRMLK